MAGRPIHFGGGKVRAEQGTHTWLLTLPQPPTNLCAINVIQSTKSIVNNFEAGGEGPKGVWMLICI